MFWTVDQGHMKDWDGPPPQKDIQKAENGTLNQGLLSVDKVSTRWEATWGGLQANNMFDFLSAQIRMELSTRVFQTTNHNVQDKG